MERSLESLTAKEFDVVVIGGGIYGACVAREAATRGLSVALLEYRDFGWATSANMHRILHGGFRYLRNADFKRIRESVRERNAMMRMAPHLTGPLPFLVPTTRSGIQRKDILGLALKVYDLLAFDRNRGIHEPARQIRPGRLVSRDECLRLAPYLDTEGVTGGAIWYDGCLKDPARLTLLFVRSALFHGAVAVNYVRVTGLLCKRQRVTGVNAKDQLSGETFDVRARIVVNCTGPWANETLGLLGQQSPATRYVRSIDVVLPPLTAEDHGLAVMAPQDGSPNRLIRYFVAPWNGVSVLGSVDYMNDTDPESFQIRESELEHLIEVVRRTMPRIRLTLDDILAVQAGLIPHDGTRPLDDPYNAARHYQVVDHRRRLGIDGLITVTGIKYTTARDVAEKTVDHLLRRLDAPRAPSVTAWMPLWGGAIEDLGKLVDSARRTARSRAERRVIETLVGAYGAGYGEVLSMLDQDPTWSEPITPGSPVLGVQIAYAVRYEMAQKLTDVAVRRTQLAGERHPGREALRLTALLMGRLLDWSNTRVADEIRDAEAYLSRFWMRPDVPSSRPRSGGPGSGPLETQSEGIRPAGDDRRIPI